MGFRAYGPLLCPQLSKHQMSEPKLRGRADGCADSEGAAGEVLRLDLPFWGLEFMIYSADLPLGSQYQLLLKRFSVGRLVTKTTVERHNTESP